MRDLAMFSHESKIAEIKKQFERYTDNQIIIFLSELSKKDFDSYLSTLANACSKESFGKSTMKLSDNERELYQRWYNIAMEENKYRATINDAKTLIDDVANDIHNELVKIHGIKYKEKFKDEPLNKETKYSKIKKLINTIEAYQNTPDNELTGEQLFTAITLIKDTVVDVKKLSDTEHNSQIIKKKKVSDVSKAMDNIQPGIKTARDEMMMKMMPYFHNRKKFMDEVAKPQQKTTSKY